MREVNIKENNFFTNYADSIVLYDVASSEKSSKLKATIAKSSIILANISLESSANGFLESLNLNSRMKKKIDLYSTLDKFDFILQWHTGKPLPRGGYETQSVSELIEIRNSIVHSKIKKLKVPITTKKGDAKIAYYHTVIDNQSNDKYPISKLTREPGKFTEKDALIALKIVTDFLNEFIELWGIDVNESALYLLPTCDGSIQTGEVMHEIDSLKTILSLNEKLGVRFLGLYGLIDEYP